MKDFSAARMRAIAVGQPIDLVDRRSAEGLAGRGAADDWMRNTRGGAHVPVSSPRAKRRPRAGSCSSSARRPGDEGLQGRVEPDEGHVDPQGDARAAVMAAAS